MCLVPQLLLGKDELLCMNSYHNNDYNDIRFSVAYMGIMDCHPEKMDQFYTAVSYTHLTLPTIYSV